MAGEFVVQGHGVAEEAISFGGAIRRELQWDVQSGGPAPGLKAVITSRLARP